MKNIKIRLLENTRLSNNAYLLSFSTQTQISFLPGQFLMLDIGKNLRRPFAIANFEDSILKIIVKPNGRGTKSLVNSPVNTDFEAILPLGTPYKLHKDNNIIIAGGIGVASIYSIVKNFNTNKINYTLVLGFKTKTDIPSLDIVESAIIYTEDGSYGKKGFPIEYLHNINPHNIYACGPSSMLKILQEFTQHRIQVSLEERMGCGVGACLSCVVKTKDGPKRVCKDGPVFNVQDIVFS